jgi:diguanylate cyclase (GGDEF)-like protein
MKEKILIVDDEPHVLQGYKRSLRKQFKLDTAPGGKEALEQIDRDGPYAIVVSDMRMPGMTGLALLTTLKEKSPEIIRIMLTGNADQKTAVDAVNKGEVFKFLTKPCRAETMAATLEAGFAQYHQIQEKRSILEQSTTDVQILSEKLSYQSQHDYLTGLANRQAFELRIQHFLETARNDGAEHALCYLDLDHFHVINDTCGHFAGDECLRQISDLLSSQQRGSDVLARLAADQFSLLLHDCEIEEAENFVRGVQELLRQFSFEWESELFNVTASIGLVPINNASAGVAKLLSSAETACNVIKDSGGNNLHVSGPNDKTLTQRLDESQWVSQIHLALRDDRFQLFFQPITPIDNTNQEGDHFEILIRMLDEQGQFISPGIFLQAAENYYLSPQIDRWVIKNVEAWLRCNPDHMERLAKCAINLSGHSLGNEDILNFICETFEDSPVPANKICFEVTETAAIAHLNRAIEFIKTLKAKGFYFSLDDFGSGFSSFAYLKNLPVDYLKIDGQFVKQIHNDVVDRAMVKSINEIGKVMGKQTIAEFVENQEIMDILEILDVDYAQGHLFAMARPLAEKE